MQNQLARRQVGQGMGLQTLQDVGLAQQMITKQVTIGRIILFFKIVLCDIRLWDGKLKQHALVRSHAQPSSLINQVALKLNQLMEKEKNKYETHSSDKSTNSRMV
jgi:hypothetical protein